MAIASIIPNSNKVPGTYIKVSLGVGARVGGGSPYYVLLTGNSVSTGTMSNEVEYDALDDDTVRTLAGAKSELYWMYKYARAAAPGASLKMIAVARSAGTAASNTITVTGTATSGGTVGVTIMGEEIEVAFSNGDANTAVAAAIEAAIDDQTDWPVSASVLSNVVTVTASLAGPRGNHIRYRVRVIDGTGITVAQGGNFLASGATSDDPQNVLDAVDGLDRRYIVAPYQDSSNLAKYKTHIDAQDEPLVGVRKRFVAASIDTLANTTTVATTLNFSRGRLAWLENADVPPACLAAAWAAYCSVAESADPAANLDSAEVPGIPSHYTTADVPTASELAAALNNGITPLQSTTFGTAYCVRSVTLRSQDSASNPDYRVLDTHKVEVPDFIADDLELQIADTFAGFKASDDPPEGQVALPGVATPSLVRDLIISRLRVHEGNALLDSGSVDRNLDGTVVELSKITAGKFNIVVPVDVIELAHQFAADIRQIG